MIIILSGPFSHSGSQIWDAHTLFWCFSKLHVGAAEKKIAAVSEVPPKKPPRRTSSVTMKKPMNTETTVDDVGHEYEVIH